jgi:hypothetical protein
LLSKLTANIFLLSPPIKVEGFQFGLFLQPSFSQMSDNTNWDSLNLTGENPGLAERPVSPWLIFPGEPSFDLFHTDPQASPPHDTDGSTLPSSPLMDFDDGIPVDSKTDVDFPSEDGFSPEIVDPDTLTNAPSRQSVQGVLGCGTCGLSFETNAEIQQHLMARHGVTVSMADEQPKQAKKSPKRTKKVDAAQKKKKSCPDCSTAYRRTDELAGHIAGVHFRVKFQCPEKDCQYALTESPVALKKHMRDTHDTHPPASNVRGIPASLFPGSVTNLCALKEALKIAKKIPFESL